MEVERPCGPERLAMESRGDQGAWLLPLGAAGKAGSPVHLQSLERTLSLGCDRVDPWLHIR